MAERLQPAVRRERILAVALEVLSEQGYRGLTMKLVATRCGITSPGVTYYFRDRHALLMAVLERRDALDMDQFLTPRPDGTVSGDDIVAAVASALRERTEASRLHSVLAAEAIDSTHPAHDFFERRTERTVTFLARRLGDRYRDPLLVARALVAALDGVQSAWLRDPDRVDLDVLLRVVVGSIVGAAERVDG